MRKLLVATGLVAVLAAPAALHAQSANMTVSADVQTALSVNAQNNLNFGAVVPGQTKTILPTDAASGFFLVDGAATTPVNVSFTLPATLTRQGGAETMPITFGATSASRSAANPPVRAGSTLFNPNTPITTPTNAVGQLGVFIGGAVTAAANQVAGTYNGQITINVAY
ncbi:MAG: DUF4402 domain-containing protein [Gemmatimonadales bacterium]|nr:DUF4402 domain-containing protein [Gemmatimonadales bacterium]